MRRRAVSMINELMSDESTAVDGGDNRESIRGFR